MVGILLGFFLLYLCFSVGNALLGLFRLGKTEDDESFVFGTALGLGSLSYGVLVLGLFQVLAFWWLWGFLAVFTLVAVLRVRGDLRVLGGVWQCWLFPLGLFDRIVLVLGGFTLFMSFAGLLAPDIANDSLCYHLHLPKVFLAHQAIGLVPHEFNALFPFLMEMLYTLGLGIFGVTLAQFFHYATGILMALGVVCFSRRMIPVQYAWWGGLLLVTTPVIVNQFTTTYVDVGLACFSWIALMAAFRWVETRNPGWVLLAGIFSGFVLSVKYLGLISVAGIFLFLAWDAAFGKRQENPWRLLALFCFGVFVCSAYWYFRSYFELGNPVFPYFAKLFGSGDSTIHYDDIGFPRTWLNFILSPWRMTMSPEKFEGFGVQIGPAYLAFLPLASLSVRKNRWALALGLFAFFFLGCWFMLGQDMRFFIPALPVLAALIAMGLSSYDKPDILGKGMRVLLVLALCVNVGLALYHFRGTFRAALGLESREAYLSRTERSYRVAQFVNRILPKEAKILAAEETHLFYFNRPIVRESIYAFDTRYAEGLKSPRDVLRTLADNGFTHILVVESPYRADFSDMDVLRIPRVTREMLNELAGDLRLLYNENFNVPNGQVWNYRLYQITTGQDA